MSDLDISEISNNLYIAAWPKGHHREDLLKVNTRLVISMILQMHDKELDQPPMKLLRFKTVDSVITPIPIKVLEEGSMEAVKYIDKGEAVVVYCKHGIHRSPAMAAAILIRQGYTVDEAVSLIKEKRPVASPDSWHIKDRLLKFEKKLNSKNN